MTGDAPLFSGNPFREVVCTLNGCGALLHIEVRTTAQLVAGLTAENIRNGGDSTTWEVRCLSGHVVAVPDDDAQEWQEFGICRRHDGEDDHDASCDDMARIRAMAGTMPDVP